jgi:broad specificity phosphatase PhoE
MLKKLVIARHGDYNFATGTLTDLGVKQMQALGNALSELLGNPPTATTVLSSVVSWAQESAKHVALALKVQNIPCSELSHTSVDKDIPARD